MKKRILFIALSLLFIARIVVHAEAYAVYCEVDSIGTLYFLCSDTVPNGTHDGKTIIEMWSGEDVTNTSPYNGYTGPGWILSRREGYMTRVVFEESFKDARPTNLSWWFSFCYKLTSIEGIENLNTSSVTDMSGMFFGCSGLSSLDLSSFNTSNVTDMGSMFFGCSGLTSLDLSGFNTSNVIDMCGMFQDCSGLTSLDLGSFNTSSVTDMRLMFERCKGLSSLDVSSFNTSSVTDMWRMFFGCSGLTSLDLSSFNTSSVTNMEEMFSECSGLTSLDLSSFNTSSVTNMEEMFSECSGLTSLDLSSFNTSSVTDMGWMFYRCKGLSSLNLSSFNTSGVTNMERMFTGCSGLTSLDLSSFNTSNVTNMEQMFSGCSGLISLDLSNFNLLSVNNIEYGISLSSCDALEKLDLRNVTGDIRMIIPISYNKIGERIMIIIVPEETDLSSEVFKNKYIVKLESGTSFIGNLYGYGGNYLLYLPFAVDAKANGTFYKYHDCVGSEVIFMSVEDATTEANTAYLFEPKDGFRLMFTSSTVLTEYPKDIEEGAASGLYGVYTTSELLPVDDPAVSYYMLSYDFREKRCFRKVNTKTETTVQFNSAYLKIADADAPTRLTLKLIDASTGISSVSASDTDASAPAYNMQGQRVSGSYKGIVIKNGKKVVLR